MFTMNSVSDSEPWDMGPRWLIYPILSHPSSRLPVCKYFILFSIIIIIEINV